MSTIFILDDDDNLLIALTLYLPQKGYQVFSFHTSAGLLATLSLITPDMILLDVVLAEEKDGKCLCLELKQKYHYPNSIYLFSATPLKDFDVQTCEADGFIGKPFELKTLLGTLNPALKLKNVV